MEYVVHRRFKRKALCGDVNIPATSQCEELGGVIYYNGQRICGVESRNAHQFFARNDDGNGMLRGKLIQAIQEMLEKRDKGYLDRWDKVWSDPLCKQYKRSEFADYWLWNHSFFNADIITLQYIASLIGVKKEI